MGYIRSHDAAIYYEEYGAGQPLILLPGLLGTVENTWRRFVPGFAKGFHTVVVDLRGHGKTNNPAGSLNLQLLVDDLGSLIDALGFDQVMICGYSLGGYIGLEYGIRNPGRVERLIMHATKFFWSGPAPRQIAADMDPEKVLSLSPEMVERLRGEHAGKERWRELLNEARTFIAGLPDNGIAIPSLTSAQFPILVSVGENDTLIPSQEAHTLAHHLPFGQVQILQEVGHAMNTVGTNEFLSLAVGFLGPALSAGHGIRNSGSLHT
jgi:pimeloyl-ACP methyl ester carboxylesterase